jgi:periplasmic protein CpxP/Spy
MRSKIMLLLVSIMLLGATNVFAMKGGKDDCRRGDGKECDPAKMEQMWQERHNEHMDEMQKDLGLSLEQKEQVSKILKDGWAEIKIEKDQMHEKVKAIMDKNDLELAKVLTPDQMEKLKAVRKMTKEMEMKGKGKHKKDKKHCKGCSCK